MKTNLLELIDSSPPNFHHFTLSRWHDWKASLYFKDESIIEKNAAIDLNDVIGHAQGYPKMSWAEMITKLKRFGGNLRELEKTPDYYLRVGGHKDWYFIESDGAVFIGEGKHRSTIARYLAHYNPDYFEQGSIIKGVEVIHKQVDHHMMDNMMAIHQLLNLHGNTHLRFYHASQFAFNRKDNVYLRNDNKPNELPLTFHKSQIDEVRELLEGQSFLNKYFGNKAQKYLRD